ncbi:MAG: four helix bundle protein [Candidatus Marinimicrobia bacterium]|nr:four helix bundle protein [Candidatus Neomarinimicrobiota bacterium]
MFKSFTDMPVWQTALELSEKIFMLSSNLPKWEDYGLTSQIRRSSNSISSNIAEGFGRNGKKDKCYFYIVSRGSAYETQHHLIYGQKIGYFPEDKVKTLIKHYNNLIYDLNKIIKSMR